MVYVTHSPFLINRNAGHRIRVIDKGTNDEGTRIVRDATKNHYEPLRSSLGAFVAETAFIGGSNLFVEGLADQVLLAGVAAYLRRGSGSTMQVLDLNEVTIVPAGSAGSIPYLVYLARGRDQVRPPCAVLLDGDAQGRDAHKALLKGGARDKRIIDDRYIVRMDTWAATADVEVASGVAVEEAEDLIPIPVAVEAARAYAMHLLGLTEEQSKALREADVKGQLNDNNHSLWDALAAAFADRYADGAHIEKVGFAKEVIAYADKTRSAARRPSGLKTFEDNFAALIAHLTKTLRAAKDREEDSRRDNRLRRIIDGFLMDHQTGVRRDQAMLLIDEIDTALDDSNAGDLARHAVAQLRREFKLESDPTSPVSDFTQFRERVSAIVYQQRLADQNAAAGV